MMLKVYNSLTQKIETFQSIEAKKVSMYVCGPTVYDDIHLGNARPVIFFDVFKRYLTYIGYQVFYASNITDVDDRIIQKAIAKKVTEDQIAQQYTTAFIEMTTTLGSQLPDEMPKATHYIKSMTVYIQNLIDKGFAYLRSGGVYFRVGEIPNYGILSNQNIEELNAGVRITLDEDKEDPRDFSLWKFTKEGVTYPSPWGEGRPGWHTECAVMNHDLFGKKIDVHGGGTDLKFPHHENEIAQSIAHDDHSIANYWLHVGRLDVDQVKMSKSLGNIRNVKDLILNYHPYAFRLLILAHHYRHPIQYSESLMEQFQKEYDKIKRTIKKSFLRVKLADVEVNQVDQAYLDRFALAMNDDFNTPNVLTLIYEILKAMNKEADESKLAVLINTISKILDVLGINEPLNISSVTLENYHNWENARLKKDYAAADVYREKLTQEGWI